MHFWIFMVYNLHIQKCEEFKESMLLATITQRCFISCSLRRYYIVVKYNIYTTLDVDRSAAAAC